MKLKDLKITYNVLCELDCEVPNEILVHIAERVRTEESRALERRKARMTEEQLIHLENKQKRILRIYLPDGRMIQKPHSDDTFREAIREAGAQSVAQLGLRIGRKDVVLYDATLSRRRIRNRYFLEPGYFLVDGCTAVEKYGILCRIDECLHLNWDIELV